jgi:energy-coupling factor transport system substrate-specific component
MEALQTNKSWYIAMVAIGIILNLAIGLLLTALKVPIFLDMIGTIVFTLIGGWRLGAIIGVASLLVGGIFNPVLPYFILSPLGIVAVTTISASRGGFRLDWRVIVTGIIMGVVAAILSAPVVAGAFGGHTPSGESRLTNTLVGPGKTLWTAVVTTKLWTEPIDKTIQCFLAVGLIKSMPLQLLELLRNYPGYLRKNYL